MKIEKLHVIKLEYKISLHRTNNEPLMDQITQDAEWKLIIVQTAK